MSLLSQTLVVIFLIVPVTFNNLYAAPLASSNQPAQWQSAEFDLTNDTIRLVVNRLQQVINGSKIRLEIVKLFQFRGLDIGYEFKTLYNSSSLTVSR